MDINFNKNYSSGNDENKSENERKMKQKMRKTPSKNFMSPTISAKSKITSPKKRILTEWNENSANTPHQKSTNLGKVSTFNKLGVSNNPIPKIPTLPSPVLNDKSDENVEIGDGFVVPYDPLTNYLSPRPKFLRYNPRRLRDRVGFDDSSDDSTNSSRSTEDPLSSCGSEGCLVEEKEADDIGEEVIDDEEEVFEERKWGLKWKIAKCLMVFCVLVFSAMYITSMNMNVPLFDEHKYGNLTSGVASLFEIDRICVDSDRIMGHDLGYENEVDISDSSLLGNFVDQGLKRENDEVVESEKSSLVDLNDSNLVDLEPKCQVGEILAHVFFEGIEEKDVDFEEKLKDGGLELVDEVYVAELEAENMDDEQQFEVGLACEEVNVEIEVMDEDEKVTLVVEDVDFVGEVIGEELRGEIGLNDKDETVAFVGEDDVEYEQNETSLQTSKSVVLVLILSLMTLVVPFLVTKLYYKLNKPSSKTSNTKKLRAQQAMKKQKPPPKVVEGKLEPIQRVEITPTPTPTPTTTRVIPKVKLLCEFDVVGEVMNKRSESDTTSSHLQASRTVSGSIGGYVCKEMTSSEHGKEEAIAKATPTPVRRSSRLRSRVVISP